MITQVIQYKNLDEKYKSILTNNFSESISPDRMVYLIKNKSGVIQSITTSVAMAIKKTQVSF